MAPLHVLKLRLCHCGAYANGAHPPLVDVRETGGSASLWEINSHQSFPRSSSIDETLSSIVRAGRSQAFALSDGVWPI